MLEDGESAASAAPGTPIDHTGRPDFGAAIRPDGTFDPDRAVEAFYADCDPDAAAAAIAALRPQNLANLGQSPAVIGWRGKPTTYAVCTDDLAVHPDLQRVLAQRAGTVVEWPTGHSPFLSRPDLVVDLLAAL
jgi:pimeloyl-ACP methyl ester carboxylesterase